MRKIPSTHPHIHPSIHWSAYPTQSCWVPVIYPWGLWAQDTIPAYCTHTQQTVQRCQSTYNRLGEESGANLRKPWSTGRTNPEKWGKNSYIIFMLAITQTTTSEMGLGILGFILYLLCTGNKTPQGQQRPKTVTETCLHASEDKNEGRALKA